MKKLSTYYLKISFLDNIESVVHLEGMDEMEKRGSEPLTTDTLRVLELRGS